MLLTARLSSWNGKRWAVAVAGQRPTAACGNRGGVTIHVATLSGKTFTLDVAASDSVASVKARIHGKGGIPPEEQCLVFRGKLLEDERTLQDYCVFKDAELELLGRVPGGVFGCCSRDRAAALASVVPSPSERAPSGSPQRQAFTEVPDALQF